MAHLLRSISFKIFGVAVGLLVLMALASGWSMYTTAQVNRQLATLSEALLPLALALEDVSDEILRGELSLREAAAGTLAERDCAARFGEHERAVRRLLDDATALQKRGAALAVLERNKLQFARLSSMLENIGRSHARYLRDVRALCSAAGTADGRAADQAAQLALVHADAQDINELVAAASSEMSAFVSAGAIIVEGNQATALRANAAMIVIAALVGLLLAWVVSRGLTRPIGRLREAARAVQRGDLDGELQVTSRDEIGDVSIAFNQMVGELRDKERIKQTFGQYVDPRIVNSLIEGRADQASGGEKQIVTVYFSDLVAFTSLAERLSPGGLVTLINDYFDTMSAPIRERNGIIDKYIGDSVMAFWTVPFAPPTEQAALACAAALTQFHLLEDFRRRMPDLIGLRQGLPLIDMRVGMASGEAIVGSVGGSASRSFTVMGDTVNLGSRLEGSNKVYGTHILIDQNTRDMAGDAIRVRGIDRIAVKGKSEPSSVYELLGMAGDPLPFDEDLLAAYAAGLDAYLAGDWPQAQQHFAECERLCPADSPSKVMKRRCEMLTRRPPATWDGVWILTSK
ncbi:MAG: adenylate/guanylate cyclase domain-containing protein [Rhodocyclaceae bacterium]|nr:adenylate/guanylate cyclase domain-containing protein [Rhodocyclaceae bacterium]